MVEVGVCTERILSDLRWNVSSLRMEGTLSHVKNQGLVPMLQASVNPLHACAQLLAAANHLTGIRPVEESGVRRRYFDSLQRFYEQEEPRIAKIPNQRVRELAGFYLRSERQG